MHAHTHTKPSPLALLQPRLRVARPHQYLWVAVVADVELSKGANVPNTHDLDGEVAEEVNDVEGSGAKSEDEEEGRHHGAQQLFQDENLWKAQETMSLAEAKDPLLPTAGWPRSQGKGHAERLRRKVPGLSPMHAVPEKGDGKSCSAAVPLGRHPTALVTGDKGLGEPFPRRPGDGLQLKARRMAQPPPPLLHLSPGQRYHNRPTGHEGSAWKWSAGQAHT